MATVYSQKEYHVQLEKGDVGRYVILPGDPGRCEKIAAYFDDAKLISSNREFTTYTGTLLGEKVSVTSTGIGGPSAVIALEELTNCGADTFIRVGTSGGMQPEVLAGDVVIATGAIRAEGTSREYAPIAFPAVPHYDTVIALKEAAERLGASHHLGVVQCKDSFYGQHEPQKMPVAPMLMNDWEAWKKLGALTSEMESAALFIAGAYRRVRTGAIMLVVGNQTRREMGLPDIQVHDTDVAIRTAVEAIKIMIKREKGNQ